MLRPADLLPPWRLLTPRLGHRDLSRCLGSATRRSGAYRGGTCTRWIRTTRWARSRTPIVTTRHPGIVLRRDNQLPSRADKPEQEIRTGELWFPPDLLNCRQAVTDCRPKKFR